MERIPRRFILFQGAVIGIFAMVNAISTIHSFIIDHPHPELWDYYSDIHGMTEVIIPRELCWAVAAVALLYGIHRQDIRFFYPIIVVAIGGLVLELVREIVLFWVHSYSYKFFYFTLLCNPALIISLICRKIHGTMTLMALKRLFESEQTADNNFVRFNADSDACEAG
ncbi:uncharacterized protein LOC135704588 [Ochlerotatus camptorhynchus]|uniref:uncharacterized protein LOC135704588 n=1 Tax=Ochlerotatus camptorhynchus TaxID=644619 RepID=UPI0031DAF305